MHSICSAGNRNVRTGVNQQTSPAPVGQGIFQDGLHRQSGEDFEFMAGQILLAELDEVNAGSRGVGNFSEE